MTQKIATCFVCAVFALVVNAQRIDAGDPASSRPDPMRSDPMRAGEFQQRALSDRIRQQDRELRVRQEMERREFETRFNQLVEAMSGFVKQYNDGKGMIWPQHEADKLSKALRELQHNLGAVRSQQRASSTRNRN
jgi:hypothetical protein